MIESGTVYMEGKVIGNFVGNFFGRRSEFVKTKKNPVIFLVRIRIFVTASKYFEMGVF